MKFSLAYIELGPEALLVCMVIALSEAALLYYESSSTDMVVIHFYLNYHCVFEKVCVMKFMDFMWRRE